MRDDSQTSAVVRAAYVAFNARDVEAGVELMADDVLWPNVPDGGFLRGADAVRAHWREQFEAVDPEIQVLALDAGVDGAVRAVVRQVVRSHDGAVLADERQTHLFTVRDGLIRRMHVAE